MSISSAAGTPARATVTPEASSRERERISRFTSSASLQRFALGLFCGRIPASPGPELPGLGSGSERAWSRLVTLSCPSDCGPVASACTTGESGCSCSPSYPTPVASDHKGSTGKGSRRGTLAERLAVACCDPSDATTRYPHPEFAEALMGFPIGHSGSSASETPSRPSWASTSGDSSSSPSENEP